MAFTLSNAMVQAWRELGMIFDSTATGGSATTIIDTKSPWTADDAQIGGTAIITRDAGGAGASPEGRFARVTDYVASTTTFTIDTVTDAVASGDSYAIARKTISLNQMIQAVNDGLTGLQRIALVDTSLTVVSNQTEYDIPVGLKMDDFIDILLQAYTDDSDDNQYYSIKSRTQVLPAAPGSTGLLVIPPGLPAGYTIKLIYNGVHPKLAAYSGIISETIPQALAVAATIDKAMTWLGSKRIESSPGLLQRWNDAKQTLANAKIEHPIWKPERKPRFFVLGRRNRRYPGDQSYYDR